MSPAAEVEFVDLIPLLGLEANLVAFFGGDLSEGSLICIF